MLSGKLDFSSNFMSLNSIETHLFKHFQRFGDVE